MAESTHLLFFKEYSGTPLFKSQLDLVVQLLNHPESEYHISPKKKEEYTKAQSRLKTYISQLLSSNVNRSITEDFKQSLLVLVSEKLKGTTYHPEQIVDEIIKDLKEKNLLSGKFEPKQDFADTQISKDLAVGEYIAVITSRPLDISWNVELKGFSFQRFLIADLIESFTYPDQNLKYYRFNFPLESFGELFWKGLKKFIRMYINRRANTESLHKALYSNYYVMEDDLNLLKKNEQPSNDDLEKICDNILYYLNKNRYILVFINPSPMYTIPLIAIDPDAPKTSKIYTLLDNGNQNLSIHKYSSEDYMLWRLFVWDKLKTSSEIKQLKYKRVPFE